MYLGLVTNSAQVRQAYSAWWAHLFSNQIQVLLALTAGAIPVECLGRLAPTPVHVSATVRLPAHYPWELPPPEGAEETEDDLVCRHDPQSR